jgi:hypothetical protein
VRETLRTAFHWFFPEYSGHRSRPFYADDLTALRALAEAMTRAIHFILWPKPSHVGQFWLFHAPQFPTRHTVWLHCGGFIRKNKFAFTASCLTASLDHYHSIHIRFAASSLLRSALTAVPQSVPTVAWNAVEILSAVNADYHASHSCVRKPVLSEMSVTHFRFPTCPTGVVSMFTCPHCGRRTAE